MLTEAHIFTFNIPLLQYTAIRWELVNNKGKCSLWSFPFLKITFFFIVAINMQANEGCDHCRVRCLAVELVQYM